MHESNIPFEDDAGECLRFAKDQGSSSPRKPVSYIASSLSSHCKDEVTGILSS